MDHSTYRTVCHSLCGVIVRWGANLSYEYAGHLITIFFSEETWMHNREEFCVLSLFS